MKKIYDVLPIVFLSLIVSLAAKGLHADVRVGVITYNPPFVFGVNQGFDVDLINLVCQRLKMTCALFPMPFNQVFKALDEGKIELVIGGITMPEAGLDNYIATMPYLISRGQFLVLNNDKLNAITDLYGGKVGVIKGGTYNSASFEYLQHFFTGKLSIVPFDDPKTLLAAFTDGAIDGAFINESSAIYWNKMSQGKFKLLGQAITLGKGLGFVALPNNSDLINKINQALHDIENDGSYIKLYKAYLTVNP